MKRMRLFCFGFALAAWGGPKAMAGPPYVTDDPEPTRTGGWENYVFITGNDLLGQTAGEAAGELNYGAAPNLQLTLDLPLAYQRTQSFRAGAADLAVSVKYRFFHPPESSALPDLAVFPRVTLPSGARFSSTGHPTLFLPVWAEKDLGDWSIFGGGGYDINPGRGDRDFGLLGWAVTRNLGRGLNLGVEIYHQTPAVAGGSDTTNLGFGIIYQITTHWALMASGGPGLQSPSRSGASAFYASVQFTN